MKKIFNSIYHPLFLGSAVMVIGSNGVNFLNYLYRLVMGRILGPVSYSELAAVISLLGLLSIVSASISLVVVKYVSSAKNIEEVEILINWFKKNMLKLSLILFTIFLILAPQFAAFLNINKVYYFYMLAVSFLFSLQSMLNRAILQGLFKFKEMVVSLFAENTAKLILGVLLVYFGFSIGGALFGFIVAIFLGWYITNLYLREYFKKVKETNLNVKSMLRFSFPVLVQSLATTSLYSSDVLLVKHFFPPFEAGIYAALSTLGTIIFYGAGPISSVMFPLISQRQSKGLSYNKIFIYSLLLTGFFSAGLLFIYWIIPEFTIKLLYGPLYIQGVNLLVWFGVFMSLFSLCSLVINYNLSLGKTNVVSFPFMAAAVQVILIWFIHDSLFSVVLISLGVTALLFIALLIYSTYGRRISNSNKINFSHSPGI